MDQHAMAGMTMPTSGAPVTVAAEHLPALLALLTLLVAVATLMATLEIGRGLGLSFAARLSNRLQAAGPATRLAGLLMLMTGVIHLALVPGHLHEDPVRAALFVLNGSAFLVVVFGVLLSGWAWRIPAQALLVATIAAYALYLLSGREEPDLVGVATKLIEVGALGMLTFSTPLDSLLAVPGISALARSRLD